MHINFRSPLLLVSIAHFTLELSNNYLPVLYPILINTLNLSYTQVGLIALVAALGGTLAQPAFGYLSDRWKPRYIIVSGVVWTGVVMGLTGFTGNYIILVCTVGLGALGSAAFHPAGAALAGSGKSTNRGAAVSIFSVGGNIGAATSPLLVAAAIHASGLRGTAVIIPLALIGGTALHILLRRQANTQHNNTLTPTNQANPAVWRGSAIALALVVAIVTVRSWVQMSLSTYLPEWIETQGGTLVMGSRLLFVFSASIAVGSLLGGTASDRVPRWHVVASSLLVLSITAWLFPDITGTLRVALLCTAGIAIGASFPVAIVMAQEVWPRGAGVASALAIGVGWLLGGIGPSITGILADRVSLSVSLRALAFPPLLGFVAAIAFAIVYARATTRPA